MGGQMQELLLEVSRNLSITQRLLEEVQTEQRRQSDDIGDLRERVARLEEVKEWNGEERREVRDRLGSGDQTFLKIARQIKDAEEAADRAAQTAKTALDAIDAHTSGKHGETRLRKKALKLWAEILAPYLVPALISGAGWLFYHLRFVADVAVKEGHR